MKPEEAAAIQLLDQINFYSKNRDRDDKIFYHNLKLSTELNEQERTRLFAILQRKRQQIINKAGTRQYIAIYQQFTSNKPGDQFTLF